jgi:hypothetical protein
VPGGTVFVNPGGVGLSFHDPTRAYFLVFERRPGAAPTLTWSAVPYADPGAVDRLRAANIPFADGQATYLAGALPIVQQTMALHAEWASAQSHS